MKISISKSLLLLIASLNIVFSVSAQAQHDPLTVELCDRHMVIQNAVIQWFTDETSIDRDMLNCNDLSTNERLLEVKYLDFSGSNLSLSNIPDLGHYERLENVERVSFANNNVEGIPDEYYTAALFRLPPFPLDQLDFSNNSFTTLPADICLFSNSVLIGGNNISNITSPNFSGCDNLITLDISNNGIASLPANFFDNLGSLESLNAKDNLLTSLPDGFFPANNNLKTVLLAGNTDLIFSPTITFTPETGLVAGALDNDNQATFTVSVPSGLPFTHSFMFTLNSLDATLLDENNAQVSSVMLGQATSEITVRATFINPTFTVDADPNDPANVCNATNCYSGFNFAPVTAQAYAVPEFYVSSETYDLEHNTPVNIMLPQAGIITGKGPYTYSITPANSSALTGLELNPTTAQLTGTPTTTMEAATLSYIVTDALNQSVTIPLTLSVGAAKPAFGTATVANINITVNDPLTQTLPLATDGNDVTVYSLTQSNGSALPAGLVFNPSSNVLSGTATVDGTYMLNYTATDNDGLGAATLNFNVIVVADLMPAFTATEVVTVPSVMANQPLTAVALPEATTTGNGDTIYALTQSDAADLPAGLLFDMSARTLSGTPTEAGNYMMVYMASDSDGDTATINFNVTVTEDAMPVFAADTAITNVVVNENDMLNVTLPTVNNDANLTLTYTLTQSDASALPAGLVFTNDNGNHSMPKTISGTPTVAGDYMLNYTVSDADGDTAVLNFAVTVIDDNPSFVASTISDISIIANQDFTAVLPVATAGNGDLIYTLTAKQSTFDLDLAEIGLSFNADTRTLSGNVAEVTNYNLNYTVTDSDDITLDDTVSKSFTLTVLGSDANDTALSFADGTTITNINVIANEMITTQILPTATAGNGDIIYALTQDGGSGLPAGLAFNANSRTLSGTPTEAGNYTMIYTATDSVTIASADTKMLNFTVIVDVDSMPVFADGAMQANLDNLVVGAAIAANTTLPEATAGNGDIIYALTQNDGSGLPAGLAFNANSRTLSGTPTTAGAYMLIYTASDTDSEIASLNFNVTVQADVAPSLGANLPNDMVTIIQEKDSNSVQLPAITDGNGMSVVTVAGLPEGMMYDQANHVLTGKPMASGSFDITLTLSDSDNNLAATDEVSYGFVLEVYETIASMRFILSTEATATLPAGLDNTTTYTYELRGTLPSGISFDKRTRVLSGDSDQKGEYPLSYIVKEGSRDIARNFSLVVGLQVPEFDGLARGISVLLGGAINVTLPAATTTDTAIVYAATGLPAGVGFDAATRLLSGAPTELGEFAVTYSATDADNQLVTQDFTISISTKLELTQDIMWRQALYIAGNTVEAVKRRFSLVGESRLPYENAGSTESANFNMGDDRWFGIWLGSGSGSLDNSATDNFKWDNTIDVTQVGFDVSGPKYLVGLMQETVSASASFTVDTNGGTDYSGSYDIDDLGLISIYGGYVDDMFTAWAVASSGKGEAILNITAGDSSNSLSSGVDYSMSAVGASYTLNDYIDVSFESILAATLDLTNASFTPHTRNEGSRTKFAGNFKYNLQQNNPDADLNVVPKVSIAQRTDKGGLYNGSTVEESGLETTLGLEFKYKRIAFEFGVRTFSAENFNESSNWFTFHLIPSESKGMNLKLTRQVGSNASSSDQLFENREFDQILANMSNDQSITHLGEISYSWDTSMGNLKLFSISEESTSLGTERNVLNTYKFGFNFSSDDNKLSLSTELLSSDQYADKAVRFTGKLSF